MAVVKFIGVTQLLSSLFPTWEWSLATHTFLSPLPRQVSRGDILVLYDAHFSKEGAGTEKGRDLPMPAVGLWPVWVLVFRVHISSLRLGRCRGQGRMFPPGNGTSYVLLLAHLVSIRQHLLEARHCAWHQGHRQEACATCPKISSRGAETFVRCCIPQM